MQKSDNDGSLLPIREQLASMRRGLDRERNKRKLHDEDIAEKLDVVMEFLDGKQNHRGQIFHKAVILSKIKQEENDNGS